TRRELARDLPEGEQREQVKRDRVLGEVPERIEQQPAALRALAYEVAEGAVPVALPDDAEQVMRQRAKHGPARERGQPGELRIDRGALSRQQVDHVLHVRLGGIV